jgi:hypothetical protein
MHVLVAINMEITLNCTEPAVATIGDCAVEIPDERLVEFASNATVVYSAPRGIRMIVDYTGDMFAFQYRHQTTDEWEDLPKTLWDVRVLRHRKRIILKPREVDFDGTFIRIRT